MRTASNPILRRALPAAVLSAFALAGCAGVEAQDATAASTIEADSASFVWRFDDGLPGAYWRTSNYDLETMVHRAAWRPRQIDLEDGVATISIDGTPDGAVPFRSGEVISAGRYGLGRFEVEMKPAAAPGLASNFFLYAGGDGGPDEVLIVFPGKDTRTVLLSYTTGGQRGPSATYALPFDAADDFHVYGFERTETSVAFFVDGVKALETDVAAGDLAPPQSPAPIIASVWAAEPTQYGWTGEPDPQVSAQASFRCVSFLAAGEIGPTCAQPRVALASDAR